MSRIAYVNGSYVPHPAARVHIEDRGFQFADGVYEVCGVLDGRLLDERPHLDRLERSLGELRIAMPMGRRALRLVMRELIHRNRIRDGLLYIHVKRGVAPRDHTFHAATRRTTVVMTARRQARRPLDRIAEEGVRVVTMPDIRWRRCDIKSVSLLPNVLAKQAAREAGAFEAWLVDDEGFVTEGSSTNAWILDAAGRLITRHLDQRIWQSPSNSGHLPSTRRNRPARRFSRRPPHS